MKSLKKYWFFPAIPALFALWLVLNELVLNELFIYARMGYLIYSVSTSTFNWITFIFFAAALAALALNAANAKKPAYVLFGITAFAAVAAMIISVLNMIYYGERDVVRVISSLIEFAAPTALIGISVFSKVLKRRALALGFIVCFGAMVLAKFIAYLIYGSPFFWAILYALEDLLLDALPFLMLAVAATDADFAIQIFSAGWSYAAASSVSPTASTAAPILSSASHGYSQVSSICAARVWVRS